MEEKEAVVVGGGPAGNAAAYEMASRDVDVALLEKGVPRKDREALGADSTDAAGQLNYWLRMMPDHFSEKFLDRAVNEIEEAKFVSPGGETALIGGKRSIDRVEHLVDNRIPSPDGLNQDIDLESFGITFDRPGLDDDMREMAEREGTDYRVGERVTDVKSEKHSDQHLHKVSIANGEDIQTPYLILADGPGRSVTLPVIEQFLEGQEERIDPSLANHRAVQRNYEVPEEVYEDKEDVFELNWWIPGHSAYLWTFPLEENILEIGMTYPLEMEANDLSGLEADGFPLIEESDDSFPGPKKLLDRYLDEMYPGWQETFEPALDKGKSRGQEQYIISSTPPIESPSSAGIAITGGAMGATSNFHEGGDHGAVITGHLAGKLAAEDELDRYNEEWRRELGPEIYGNVGFAEVLKGWGPEELDRAFSNLIGDSQPSSLNDLLWTGKILFEYASKNEFLREKVRMNGDREYTLILEDEYEL